MPVAPAGRYSYNFGLIQGGASVNAIPSEARTKVDLRSENSTVLDQLAAQLAASAEYAIEAENAQASGANGDGEETMRAGSVADRVRG